MNNQDLANLLNRAAIAIDAIDLSEADKAALKAELMAAAQELAIPDMDRDETEDDNCTGDD